MARSPPRRDPRRRGSHRAGAAVRLLKLHVVALGKVRDQAFAASCADYSKRIARYGPFSVIEVKDGKGDAGLLDQLPRGCRAVLLDERGRDLTSVQLAKFLDARHKDATRDLRFVIGGPYGVGDEVRAWCDDVIRLSSMTLPHELARLVLLEQLYRAWTILRREPYHHA